MKIAVVTHPDRAEADEVTETILAGCEERGVETVVSGDGYALAGFADGATAGVDLVVSVGGDGTVLEGAQVALAAGAPVVGVNVGHIGFLAEIEPVHLAEALDRIVAGDFRVEARMTLEARLEGREPAVALNDVVVGKLINQRLASVTVHVDGAEFRTYRADAVVVATPTGSTAYSFSTGGPIMSPALESFILTAVAPHDLFDRAMVFPSGVTLRLTAATSRPVVVNVDALEVGSLDDGQWVEVRRGETPVRFAVFGWSVFPHVLGRKLHLEDA